MLAECLYTTGTSANSEVFSEIPASKNASLDSIVEFSCATPYGATVNLFWTLSGSGFNISNSDLPGGVERTTVSFNATILQNNTEVVCTAAGIINGSSVFEQSPGALLLVQGMLLPIIDYGHKYPF